MTRIRLDRRIFGLAAVLLAAPFLRADPLSTAFTYQGELRDQPSGTPAVGAHDLQFRLYDAEAGGSQVGMTLCADDVGLTNGRFTIDLDFGSVFVGQKRFLEIAVREDTGLNCSDFTGFVPLFPRQSVAASPNAMYAVNATSATTAATALTAGSAATADTATNATQFDGLPPEFYRNASNLNLGTLADMHLTNNVALLSSTQTFTGVKIFSIAPSFNAVGPPFSVSSAVVVGNLNADRLDGHSSSAFGLLDGGAQFWTGNNTFSSAGNSFSGIGAGLTFLNASNLSSGTVGDVRLSSNVMLLSNSQTVTGAKTFISNSNSYNGLGTGLFGLNATNITTGTLASSRIAIPLLLQGATDALLGTVTALNSSTMENASGVFGVATAGSGNTSGVMGWSDSPDGRGVSGYATSDGGTNYGGRFETDSNAGRGVVGNAYSFTGPTYGGRFLNESRSGRAVFGDAPSLDSTGTRYGVEGRADSATNGWGVFATGRLGSTSLLALRIDHPSDPSGKYLQHYSAESPEVINFYRGTITLDDDGGAIVDLPPYFASINTEPSYTLTAVGKAMPLLHIAEEIDASALAAGERAEPGEGVPICSFRIAGGMPGAKVSWRVEAVRNDRWVRTYGAPVEVAKQDLEMNTYQHPELYGQPKERGLGYEPEDESMQAKRAERLERRRAKMENVKASTGK